MFSGGAKSAGRKRVTINRTSHNSKLDLAETRVELQARQACDLAKGIFRRVGCPEEQAALIAEHLTESDLRGVESHGLMRVMQYVREFQNGGMQPVCRMQFESLGGALHSADGGGGSGIVAMRASVEKTCAHAKQSGIAASALRNIGHSGRLADFSERAADDGYFTIIIGGGDRHRWRMVAPYGGGRALLPTNPYCLGIPGGDHGAVVLDFATGKMAGGWIYAAHAAGALLPEDCLIDKRGKPTRQPQDYFDGGAILPKGILGYGLGLMGELIGSAMLGKLVGGEANWLIICVDTHAFGHGGGMQKAAEEILHEIRNCPPLDGHGAVQIPGERERLHKENSNGKIYLPQKIWQEILQVDKSLS